MTKQRKQNGRLESLDALRGFDMFFIMGGGPLIPAICAALVAMGTMASTLSAIA